MDKKYYWKMNGYIYEVTKEQYYRYRKEQDRHDYLREAEEEAVILRSKIGHSVAVYIKSILPERMKVKLVLIDACCSAPAPRTPLHFFVDTNDIRHITRWRYSPPRAPRIIETVFDTNEL